MSKLLKYGMVGGGFGSFIGDVHIKAIAMEGTAKLAAGCFSSNLEKSLENAERLGIDKERVYSDYVIMAEAEAARPDPIDFVIIATPNDTHYDACKAFINAGINIMCEKPLCFSVSQAEELSDLAKKKNLVFGVNYGYSGNSMVKFAGQLIKDGKLGEIINVHAEYAQEWLIDCIDNSDKAELMSSIWRVNPQKTGISSCVGDIGTHIENTVHYMTGLKIKRVTAKLDNYGMPLELNANMIVEFDNGATGNFWCSQVAAGKRNGFVIQVFGTKGMLEWCEEDCEYLKYCAKGEAPVTYSRGTAPIYGRAAEVSRIPGGHPEGFFEAFGNIYASFIGAIVKKKSGANIDECDSDYPTVDDGINGVKFIHAVIESGRNDSAWVNI